MSRSSMVGIGFIAALLVLGLGVQLSAAAAEPTERATNLESSVDRLVLKHHFGGIPYEEAKALGSRAIPHLAGILSDLEKKEFWVNAIVTLGFIEDPAGLAILTSFLDSAEGEVDVSTLRALLSVHYAIGCIASTGDEDAYDQLSSWIDRPQAKAISWSFKGRDVRSLLSNRALIGLAVSGRPEATSKLEQLRSQRLSEEAGLATAEPGYRPELLAEALELMDRIQARGRKGAFNPNTHTR